MTVVGFLLFFMHNSKGRKGEMIELGRTRRFFCLVHLLF